MFDPELTTNWPCDPEDSMEIRNVKVGIRAPFDHRQNISVSYSQVNGEDITLDMAKYHNWLISR